MDEGRKEESQNDEPVKIPGGSKEHTGKAEIEKGHVDGTFLVHCVHCVSNFNLIFVSSSLQVLATNKIAGGDGIFSGKKKIALNVE